VKQNRFLGNHHCQETSKKLLLQCCNVINRKMLSKCLLPDPDKGECFLEMRKVEAVTFLPFI
jgi:hypothetical protein